jgi:hypothetical protein
MMRSMRHEKYFFFLQRASLWRIPGNPFQSTHPLPFSTQGVHRPSRSCPTVRYIMANRRNCSLSEQDCGALYPFPNTSIPYTSESCVPDIPWFTGDVGICGWVGAPCHARGNGSNCSEFWVCFVVRRGCAECSMITRQTTVLLACA